ncbi:hypothetical protein SASPL_121232 [Salvia splendens]|uniref:Senescence regulator S40 n=1 Tax=Salvia splendens TaxID=180675 RepID=A0A8X8ZX15_SALSN|nr:uncharacterized protein LOC121740920 [Salvia splendens]KAG6419024.1 hypothetical protein SASPL_121232 [Salvia splendens]
MADFHGADGGGMAAEDYQEEEMWAMMKARDQGSKTRKNSPTSSTWHLTAARAIPRSSGGASSAPLSIPDWSKILKKNPKNKKGGAHSHHDDVTDTDDGDGDGDDEMLPPHEYLARRVASTQIASFSMCEGVGRTLKGRDLSNLRNAILTKTGFLE